jgi:hypothetical protein
MLETHICVSVLSSLHELHPIHPTPLQEHAGLSTCNSITIMDAYSRPHFILAAGPFSMHGKRQLLNACSNTPVLSMERKVFSLHGSWLISLPGDGGRLAKVQPEVLTVPRPCVRVFLSRRSAAPDFVITVGTAKCLLMLGMICAA